MKKAIIFTLIFPLIFIIFSFNPVSAQENTDLNYKTDFKTSMDNKADLQKTCYGNGGIAKIEYMGGSSSLWWYAKPSFSSAFSFIGDIEVYDGSRLVRAIPISGLGTAGNAVTGSAAAPFSGTKVYTAKLNGVATDTNGITSIVVPNCDTSYVSNYGIVNK